MCRWEEGEEIELWTDNKCCMNQSMKGNGRNGEGKFVGNLSTEITVVTSRTPDGQTRDDYGHIMYIIEIVVIKLSAVSYKNMIKYFYSVCAWSFLTFSFS